MIHASFIKYTAQVLSVLLLSSSASLAADYTEEDASYKKPFTAFKKALDDKARACDDEKIAKAIQKRFRHQAKIELGNDDLEMSSLTGMHQHRAYDATETNLIARRYCGATAHLNNGHSRTVWYIIESRMGFASFDDGVTYCVSGFDDWYVHNGACRIEQ